MSIQVLQGIIIKPNGAKNQSRFASTLVNGSWPESFAFGGWCYNSSVEIGFSSSPNTIKVGIVLEVINKSQTYAYFNIQDSYLDCSAGDGGQENTFDINLGGIIYSNYILYEYEISIENNVKILTVTFKDYSIILDKIYIGLLKRQGVAFIHYAPSILQFPIRCPDCILAGAAFIQNGYVERDIAYCSYVGINGKVYDNFLSINQAFDINETVSASQPPSIGTDIWSQWQSLFTSQTLPEQFDLNGGYLIIGTEEATEQRCGDLAQVGYNLNELLQSLRVRGLNFTGAFPLNQTDSDYIYKQNYIGSLREVLQQWCSDLGYDFYCQGKSFVGINLNKPLDISKVVAIADPTTQFGSQFALNSNTAIISYKSNSSLNNTYTQSVIMENNIPRNAITDSKSPKRYIGILPLHPIDLNAQNQDIVLRTNALGVQFIDQGWANLYEPGSKSLNYTLPLLDNRTFGDIDTAIALGHYDAGLRDIYCQQQAIHGATAEIRASNFRALGYVPLIEVTGEEMSSAIESLVGHANIDEISNLCIDKRFYRVYIGYYYPEFKNDIISWEQEAGASMYKYGIVTDALLTEIPYLPENSLGDESPTGGFYGESGTSLLRIQHNVEPACTQYYQLRDAPFKDLILYSGLLDYSQLEIPVFQPTGGIFPGGLFYAQLENEWGTDPEDFKRIMSLNLSDPCVDEFGQDENFTNIINNVDQKYQDWKVDYFVPTQTTNLQDFYDEAGQAIQQLINASGSVYDRTFNTYYNLKYKENAYCSKLALIVMTDTLNHPNVHINFTQYGTQFTNPIVLRNWVDKEREADKIRLQTETQSICSISLLQEMCDNIISGLYKTGTGDARYRCIIDENKYNFLEDGWQLEYLTSANSRGLGLTITRNPIRNNDLDALQTTFANADYNGDFYYSDVLSNLLQSSQAQCNITIIYPIASQQTAAYKGVLTSQVDLETRTPEIDNILGGPNNTTNNTAATMKVINGQIDTNLQPQLDPYFMRFQNYMTIISGTGQIITTPQEYYNSIKQLNNYQLTGAMKTVELSLAGSPNFFGSFQQYLSPIYGLTKLSITVGDNGTITNLSFSDRPPVLPRQEAILTRIIGRVL
jgi:hypothetical protein